MVDNKHIKAEMKNFHEWKDFQGKRFIGFCGYKGAGKTVASKALEEWGYQDIQFSAPLKAMLRTFLEYNGVEQPELYTDDWMKNHSSRYFCNKEFRFAMQSLGTDWGRKMIGSDFWINTWNRKIKGLERVTASDVRFGEEIDTIKSKGGIIIRVIRPKYANYDTHESELGSRELKADYEVVNTNLKDFQKEIQKIEREHFDK